MIVLASNNLNKLTEVKNIFAATSLQITPQADFNIPEIEETNNCFIANALLKAYHVARQVDSPVMADDSGLEIDALNGAPGVFSARFAGKEVNFKKNINKVLTELKDIPEEQRTARFRCFIIYLENIKAAPKIFIGTWEGKITFTPIGENGFGYDPIFFLPDHNCTVAELSADLKNQLSHRAQALRKLAFYLATSC
jgi:XTP/dITP diphosphohydrolase